MLLLFYFTLWAVAIFYASWLIHYLRSRLTSHKNKDRFYYQRSFWVIFIILVFAVLLINLFIDIRQAKAM
jgi:hypothetical protein